MRIGFIVERRYLRQEMPEAVIRVLKLRGIDTDVLCPNGGRFHPDTGVLLEAGGSERDLDCYDLIVSRTRNALGLAMLSYAEAAGIPAINSHTATQRVRNKAKMAIRLGQAGVPCAPTVLATEASVLGALPREWFPLILKATYGDNSQGLRLIRRPEELGDIHWSGDLVLAQRYLLNHGFDLKLYVIGRRVFGMYKPSAFNGNPQALPRPAQPDARMVEMALRCGDTFGLEVYGVDTIETADGLAVIEVNEFPNFTGVPEAAERIVELILSRASSRKGAQNADRISPAALGA